MIKQTETNNNDYRNKSVFRGLMSGIMGCTISTFAIVLVTLILTLTVTLKAGQTDVDSNQLITAGAMIMLVLLIVQLILDIALLVLMAVSLVLVGNVSKYIKPTSFRVAFGILLGVYVVFGIVGYFIPIVSIGQLAVLITTLVFAAICKGKVRR